MNISYGVTVCNEIQEIVNLTTFLIERIRPQDEIVVLFDTKNGTKEVEDYLISIQDKIKLTYAEFDGDFSKFKNTLNHNCSGQYIFQLDADEMVSDVLIKDLPTILENNQSIDSFSLARINTVDGITKEHIDKWGWSVNSTGWINFPDRQKRIYKSNLEWFGKIHEFIINDSFVGHFPDDILYCIYHHKQIDRQERQNELYTSLNIN